jgi:hypothetical protein
MKIDLEAMAREADLSYMTADAHCREDYWTATRAELERFARLIVERCAGSLDDLGCDHCAAATRNLLED